MGGQPVAATSAVTAEQRELAEAEQELWVGNAERAIELLVMLLPRLDQPSDRARAHDGLGQAEMARGHARLATAYFQQAFDLAPNAERLYWLALSNDKGGSLERALPLYEDLAQWPTQDADPYRKIAQDRIPRILTLLGTPNPTSPPK
jgi:tetratricopeptide (TPR) repeat protein